ncbi:hypothetical protein SAMN04488128_102134 [Chitinophaga eiseniae]|uniref:DUF2264 domain-containing protein n=1 Tax=Chitinophaga eiseniae TaxID=634771 RepID=A0A1T4Q2H6_9BACT|nr:DUF2264 domain-containing protein [Chitinophaga eiseniae]SJZ97973.1 hypothetical protein SAMN04488128_102134 [Chitinophaga eiseniae]
MNRRFFLKAVPMAGIAGSLKTDKSLLADMAVPPAATDRAYNLELLLRICRPVMTHLSKGTLMAGMPTEVAPHYSKPVRKVTYLEAFGRALAGLAPWLELGPDNTMEGSQRIDMLTLTRKAIAQAVDPASPDFMNFTGKFDAQPLVDGAFMAHGLLRAPTQLWDRLSERTQQQTIDALKSLRSIKAFSTNNWVLFAAMIEIALLQFGGGWDRKPVDLAVEKIMEWYKGDSMYGDGPHFHYDYYNSFVIQPMLVDILKVLVAKGEGRKEQYALALKRMQRYGAILERQISPEGTFPVVGRSMPYRNGAFQALAQLALERKLPAELQPAQVRCALTAVNKRIFEAPGTFDKNGWLQIGFCGHQPEIADVYTSTGSLYLCATGFLDLGLPANDPYWSAPAAEWTAQKVWKGKPVQKDHAIDM